MRKKPRNFWSQSTHNHYDKMQEAGPLTGTHGPPRAAAPTKKEEHPMSEEKKEQTRGEQLRKALLYDKKNGYDRLVPGELEAITSYCTGYKQFLDAGKTERECVDRTVALAEQAGFKPYVRGGELKPGDKVYRVNRGKAITLAIIGKRPLSEGANIGAAHIDSPRLDLKQNSQGGGKKITDV